MTNRKVVSEKTGGTRLSRPTEWDDENLVGPHSLCGRWDSWPTCPSSYQPNMIELAVACH